MVGILPICLPIPWWGMYILVYASLCYPGYTYPARCSMLNTGTATLVGTAHPVRLTKGITRGWEATLRFMVLRVLLFLYSSRADALLFPERKY